ncbi:MAG TPA: prepilin-type N-terminal cleavage/methylation domain-containing protein [Tepidisphaeraceae bacterium]|jgi:prepilin-type N-terminal cleavage/methylation domain-containing protein
MMRLSSKKVRPGYRGFSLIEMMASLVIISMVSGMVLVENQNTDDSQRLDRAADEVVAALRYARIEAMGHCTTVSATTQPSTAYGVAFDTAANTVTVYYTSYNSSFNIWTLPGTAASCAMYSGQSYVINFNSQPEVEGVSISSVNLKGTTDTKTNTASPYVCQYLPFGECENYGNSTAAITLSYDGITRTISVPQIGDASKN